MEASIAVCIHDMASVSGMHRAIQVSRDTITFTCPPLLKKGGFPVSEGMFNVEQAMENPSASHVMKNSFFDLATNFKKKRQNLVVFAYGVRSTPKRQLMIGFQSEDGYAAKVFSDAISGGAGIFCISCYVVSHDEYLVDLINLSNELGVIVESVKEGPSVRMVERANVTSASDIRNVFKKIVKNYQQIFSNVLLEKQPTPELEALPPYNGDTIMLQLYRYENAEDFDNYEEANSMTFVALGDSERPVLCGVDPQHQAVYEKTHRVLLSAVGIVSGIKCNRLRLPYGKSKVSQLLRRCYNAEKNYPHNTSNAPTQTRMLLHCFADGRWAEETYHCLSMIRRISNSLGSGGFTSMLRDLQVEKWRLDQDVAELRDEILLAKTVYDYKPFICETAKPIPNIKEEELKRISIIQSKRNEVYEQQLAVIRQKSREEADELIREQEKQAGATLEELKKTLEQKKRENLALEEDRNARARDYEQTLERIRKKKEDEERTAVRTREEITQLEEELILRQTAVRDKQRQLEMAKLDKVKGKEAISRERELVQESRSAVQEERRRQREQWIKQILEINQRILDQLRDLHGELRRNGEQISAKEAANKQAIIDDIKATEEYFPHLISLEDTPMNPEEMESIRRQFDAIFEKEKESYVAKIEEEKLRKEKLEKGLGAYRSRVLEAAQLKKEENLREATRKEQHLNSMLDQVLNYLRQGVRMTKINSKGNVRRRFYFLSDNGKYIHSCELDSQDSPINRRKPSVTILISDIKKVVIGLYTVSFVGFSSEAQLARTRLEAMSDNGTYRHDPTHAITPANIGLYNYRSFGLLMRGNKSLEVVCDCDSDCEAWLVCLKRLLRIRTTVERIVEQRTHTSREVNSGNLEPICDMKYGGTLDIRNMHGFVSLSLEEATFCSENHVPPALFLRVKNEQMKRSQTSSITVYDIRVSSGLDLFRSSYVYDFLVTHGLIQLPF
ncbi:unnamed protein product [Phytomonas sp. Hart1]|nr:unnamed protein product [Phytomonas sp. Hart1]|eukprot:CCW71031.1 unnamed protein product [Phytomonas sp. isolate Hart1]